ncbi:MAG: gluconate 2-dehydrogenase subunit 3 family protein, partial [Halobacteriota archaeon]
MRLTRRHAIAALAAVGVGTGGYAVGRMNRSDGTDAADERTLEVLLAAAEVVFPSDVNDAEAFVRTYAVGRMEGRPDHAAGVRS